MADKSCPEKEKHTIALLVENQPGVLARIATLFSSKGYNINSVSVGETLDPEVSRITIVTEGHPFIIEQIVKQLRKLIDVIKVVDLTASKEDYVERELVLVKVNARGESRAEAMRIAQIFRGNIVDVSPETFTIEFTGNEAKINAALELLKECGIREVIRTGKVAVVRGPKSLKIS
ncbi:acetolactate synthase I/III small subunit [Thermosulfidibacter takaii ABI70S6]|uniref:Acetolactate synthase small subunit n=1 Tax=Thermosulfidibacter takaii (strain DSM 17441 / JCM 13301 / NBRC 103674 / ABI70S6) TaxID=1298851 RepID=A0A0S3QUS4_THET7|nr:acetolactate synthase small subunit [Thermosulfidibacter takaii]BAT72058.1 acetolactate synthase I/III small subunit [Thermosulfidibacter takaii ABI70S6]